MSSNRFQCGPRLARARAWTLPLVLSAVTAVLHAGNIFMKNGYIIQGPIVERSAGGVVLGWPHGKVLVHQRFIESVSFEASEEKQLQELESQASKEAEGEELSGSILSMEVEELPLDADKIVRTYVIDRSAAQKPTSGGVDGAGSPADTGEPGGVTGSEPVATPLERPDDLLGERIQEDSLGFALRPPKGWAAERQEGGLQLAPEPVEGEFRPSLSVFRLARGHVPGAEYASLVREENERFLTQYELLSEGPRAVAGQSGYEVVGRGTRSGHTVVVRQVLVEGPESIWLVSAFVPVQKAEAVAAAIEESLRSVELLSR